MECLLAHHGRCPACHPADDGLGKVHACDIPVALSPEIHGHHGVAAANDQDAVVLQKVWQHQVPELSKALEPFVLVLLRMHPPMHDSHGIRSGHTRDQTCPDARAVALVQYAVSLRGMGLRAQQQLVLTLTEAWEHHLHTPA